MYLLLYINMDFKRFFKDISNIKITKHTYLLNKILKDLFIDNPFDGTRDFFFISFFMFAEHLIIFILFFLDSPD